MRRLSQHFLQNKAAIEKIVAALDLQSGDTVVEIGPGHGELTLELAKQAVNIIAVEKDKFLVEELLRAISHSERERRIFRDPSSPSATQDDKIEIINGDILKILPELSYKLKAKSYKLIGNIPYYLTGFLFRIISELENKPSLIVFTIQKEVAERIVAQPPYMNLLAASIQVWAKPEIIAILPPTDFDPPPKINSAIIKLNIRPYEGVNFENYYKLIKIVFKQPRKTILNNLSDGLDISKNKIVEKLKKLDLTGTERGQDLSIEKLQQLKSIV